MPPGRWGPAALCGPETLWRLQDPIGTGQRGRSAGIVRQSLPNAACLSTAGTYKKCSRWSTTAAKICCARTQRNAGGPAPSVARRAWCHASVGHCHANPIASGSMLLSHSWALKCSLLKFQPKLQPWHPESWVGDLQSWPNFGPKAPPPKGHSTTASAASTESACFACVERSLFRPVNAPKMAQHLRMSATSNPKTR